jgi:transposase
MRQNLDTDGLTPAELAAENVALRAKLKELEAEKKVSEVRVQAEEAKNVQLKRTLQAKEDQIELLVRMLLGPTSERRSWESLEPESQLWLDGMALELPESPPSRKTTVREYERERRKDPTDVSKAGRIKHGPNATIIDVDVKDPEVENIPDDQLELVETRTTQKVVRVSSPFMIINVHAKTYRRKDDLAELVPPEVPEVFENSIYDVSFLAGLPIDKYQFHLPLYRQHQTIKNSDIFLDRGHLTRVLHRLAELLEPIYEALCSSVLNSTILTADETPTPAGRNKKKGKMDKGYFWAFFGDQKEIFYLFNPSRARVVLDDVLASFQGHLVCDGYSAYESFVKETEGTELVQCWSHTRREFIKAEKRDEERVKWVLRQIQLMYDVEEKVRGKPPNKVLKARQKETEPLVKELFTFLKTTIAEDTFVPSDPILKAANYALNREESLKAFLENPELPLDTNHLERELRPQAVGRKNWMFHVTKEGARHAAIFYSLIRSCILAGVNPTVYLVDVLQRIQTHPALKTHLLTPRLWKEHFAQAPIKSPFHEVLLPSAMSNLKL